jgi:hypothetical protein
MRERKVNRKKEVGKKTIISEDGGIVEAVV